MAVPKGSRFSSSLNSFTGSPIDFEPGMSNELITEADTIIGMRKHKDGEDGIISPIVNKVTDFLEAISKQDSILKRMGNLDAKVDSLYRIISKNNSAN